MTTPVETAIAEALARAWGNMFTDTVDASNFKATAAHILRDITPVIRAEATVEVREVLRGCDHLIENLWRDALTDSNAFTAEVAEALTRLRQIADDGTFAKPTWTGNRIEYMTVGTRHPNA